MLTTSVHLIDKNMIKLNSSLLPFVDFKAVLLPRLSDAGQFAEKLQNNVLFVRKPHYSILSVNVY